MYYHNLLFAVFSVLSWQEKQRVHRDLLSECSRVLSTKPLMTEVSIKTPQAVLLPSWKESNNLSLWCEKKTKSMWEQWTASINWRNYCCATYDMWQGLNGNGFSAKCGVTSCIRESTPESSGPPQNDFYMHWRKLMKTLQRRIHIETQNWDDGVAVANQKIGGSTHMEKK